MKQNQIIQLAISSTLVVLGVVAMIINGDTDLMFFYWLPHLWWVVVMAQFLTSRIPEQKKTLRNFTAVIVGIALYAGTLWFIIPWILTLFGVETSF